MKPLLACKVTNLNTLQYPLFTSEKLDGIRCLIKDGVAYSRTLKPIRNKYIQSILGRPELHGLDGELIVGEPNASDCMRKTNSGVMSIEGEPDFTYYTFDIWDRPSTRYKSAYLSLIGKSWDIGDSRIKVIPQVKALNVSDVERHEQTALDMGFEGLMLRSIDGMYKFGRATAKEGILFKLKRYLQEEAIVIGYEQLFRNENDPEINELGYTQRSSAKDGLIGLPMLGALIVRGKFNNTVTDFPIGTGFTYAEREHLWQDRAGLIGKIVTYKFFPIGSKEKPRNSVFVSFRDREDL